MPDALTTILDSVRMRGSVFSRAQLNAPWGVESGTTSQGIFHAVVNGRVHARLADGNDEVVLNKGDIVMMPFGHNHLLTDTASTPTRPIGDLTTTDEAGMGHLVVEGNGPETSLICGTVGFDTGGVHPVFSMLPEMIHVRDSDGSMYRIVETLIDLIAAEVDESVPGSEIVVGRLTEVLIIYVLRDYINRMPTGEVGWLGALRDPAIRTALGMMHGQPDQPWTARDLAREVGLSRSAFFAQFRDLVGESPSQYLTRWRIHVATRMLTDDDLSVSSVARQVGYQTDAAFSNAFVRLMGVRPGAYRRDRVRSKEPV